MKRFFITGIGTNVGKTFCSAILTEALQADYWKPVQTGVIESADVNEVSRLISNQRTQFQREAYSFTAPVSPHLAAAIENEEINLTAIELPQITNHLIIEGAGGILVPLNKTHYVIDIAKKFDAEVILVVRNYLGCINHSLLSINYLIKNNFKLKGLILNGNFDALVEESIVNYASTPVLAKFYEMNKVNQQVVSDLARTIDKELFL
jgi:dethiobiotin synthetase